MDEMGPARDAARVVPVRGAEETAVTNVADAIVPAVVMTEAFSCVFLLGCGLWRVVDRVRHRAENERLDWIEDVEVAWARRETKHRMVALPGWSLSFVGGGGWVWKQEPLGPLARPGTIVADFEDER